MNYYVIIPAYKPDSELTGLCTAVCDMGYNLTVVDDGSGEEFKPIFDSLDKRAVVLHHEVNRGKGAGIKTALAHIKEICGGEGIIGIMDADGQHLPTDMAKVFLLSEKNPGKLALGVRVIDKQMPWKSRAGNTITRTTFALLTGTKVSDTQTGLRAFTADMIDDMVKIVGTRYEYEMNVLSYYGSKKNSICETSIEVIYRDRENSTSHFRPWRDSTRIYFHLFKSAIKYSASAVISFLVDYGLFCLLYCILSGRIGAGLAKLVANVGARIVSSTVNYILNCCVVFERKITAKTALEYALLCICTLAIDTGVLYLWGFTGMPAQIAKIPTEVCMFVINYFIQKRLVFKK